MSLLPLALYIHLPWCLKKCPYCDFNSHGIAESKLSFYSDTYVTALIRDLESMLPWCYGRCIQTIFIGGGTPNLFSPKLIDRLLSHCRSLLNISCDVEITMEANPGGIMDWQGYWVAGVNRLSLGVQSFTDHQLVRIGRAHDVKEAWHAIHTAQMVFDSINIDLMYALPQQTHSSFVYDVEELIRAGTRHVSCYQLSIEPETAFWKHPPVCPDHDQSADMQDELNERLIMAGYNRYEVSSYSKGGNSRCQHNMNYWQYGDYIGIGAGAHGKITFSDRRIIRITRPKSPHIFMQQAGLINQDIDINIVTDPIFEFMLNSLRLVEGFSWKTFHDRTGYNRLHLYQALEVGIKEGWLCENIERVWPTEMGFKFLNDVLMLFLTNKPSKKIVPLYLM